MNQPEASQSISENTKRPAIGERLKRSLLFLMVFLPCLSILSMLFFSSVNNQRVYEKQARILLKNTTAESMGQAKTFLRNVESQLALTVNILGQNVFSANDFQALENYFISNLEVHPDFAGFYGANLEGGFFYVARDVDDSKAKYMIKTIDRDQQRVETNVWWRDIDSGRIDQEIVENDDYDPRTRPWFMDAITKRGMIWTDPYVFFTTQKLGVTSAIPVFSNREELIGVVGLDLELTELVNFLGELESTHYGSSFITSNDGLLIAAASMLSGYKQNGEINKLEMLNIMSSDDELAKRAYEAVFTKRTNSFSSDKKNFLVESMPLSIPGGEDWRIVTFADENEFLSEIRDSDREKYLLAGVLTLLSILMGWLLARNAWKPVIALEDDANHDPLTKVYNRRYLEKNADNLINVAISRNQPLSLVILDIDHFKKVNDSYGHHIGDMVLKAFVDRLKNQQRPLDLLARLGGEEFVLIMPNTTAKVAQSYLNNARTIMSSRLYDVEGYILQVTFSAGIAELSSELNTYTDIIEAADKAMYISKQLGRDQVNLA